jgi:single-stranded DNA-binding protein
MNNVTLIGRLTKDPEVRYTADTEGHSKVYCCSGQSRKRKAG